ncbi:MAG TPA: hypothetical protein DCR12_06935 [Lachnospiraceae bacterium]|nr:hypothetical protein [Lachnospiraceae bacterium]
MKNASIKTKLMLATLPSLIILIICLVFFAVAVNSTVKQSKQIYYDNLYTVSSNLSNADRDYYQALDASKSLFNMSNFAPQMLTPDLVKKYTDEYTSNVKEVRERMDKAIETAKTDGSLWDAKSEDGRTFKEAADSFNKAFDEWEKMYDVSKGTMPEGVFVSYNEKFDEARVYINDMSDIADEWATTREDELKSNVNGVLIKVIVGFAIVAILMTIWVIYLTKLIGNSIRAVSDRLKKLSQYDLSEEPIKVDSKDELGVMKQALNDTEEALESIVATLKDTSSGLINASDTVSKGTDATGVGVDNVSSAADELANASTAMAQDVSDISSNMVELSSIMERSVESAKSLSEASSKIEEVTETGTEVVEELAGINERSFVEFNAIFEAIDEIKKSGAKISEASDLILNIADQTNLLSLNASIEAARAGEAGKGFAVVADEIRNLSDESKENVDTINEILSELTAATNNAATKADVVKEFVEKQNDAVGQTKESFEAIVSTVSGVEEAIEELEKINSELDVKSREIDESVTNLSSLSEENAATSEQLSATAQTVQTNVEDLKVTQSDVESSSENLSDIVNRFILAPEGNLEDTVEDTTEDTIEEQD